MDNNFKPLPEQISEKMIASLKAGKSIFHKPMEQDGTSQFKQPFNPSTGNNYKGPTALILLMKDKDDPRWMTLKTASFNRTPVIKGEKGTLINFFKNSDIRPVLDDKGEPVLKENGKPKTESVKLEEPVLTNAWLYNGKQLDKMPELKPAPQQLTPVERAQQIIANSKAVFEPAGILTHYSHHNDTIQIPPKKEFEKPELYYATALHELAHWTAHESRLNRPLEREPDSDIGIKEELRANIASIMISAKLDLPYDLGEHIGYVNAWAQVIKDNPNELFKAAADAQKITDYVMSFERDLEVKKELAPPKTQADKLSKGEVIVYNNKQYEVLAELKNKVYKMKDLDTQEQFKMGPKDGVYHKLLEAKNNPQELRVAQETQREAAPVLAEEENNHYQMER